MRRVLGSLTILAVLTAACGTRSDRSTPLFTISTGPITADANVGTNQCTVGVGPASGVRVINVAEGSPSFGVIEVDDVITSFGGADIAVNTDLISVVRSHAVGETVPVTLARDGQSLTVQITLAPNPARPDSPIMGVLGVTEEERLLTTQLQEPDDSFVGPLTRAVDVGDDYVLFDPVGIRWARLPGRSSLDASFVVIGRDVVTATVDQLTGDVSLTWISSSIVTHLDTGDWELIVMLPPLGGAVAFSAQQPDDGIDGGTVRAIVGFDPNTGSLQWTLPLTEIGSSMSPSFAYLDPFGDRIAVEFTGPLGRVPADHYLITPTEDGSIEGIVVRGVPTTSAIFGWSSDGRLLSQAETGEFALVDPTTGLTDGASPALEFVEAVSLLPVGDGAHALADDGTNLYLIDLDGASARVLTDSCGSPHFAEPGWGP